MAWHLGLSTSIAEVTQWDGIKISPRGKSTWTINEIRTLVLEINGKNIHLLRTIDEKHLSEPSWCSKQSVLCDQLSLKSKKQPRPRWHITGRRACSSWALLGMGYPSSMLPALDWCLHCSADVYLSPCNFLVSGCGQVSLKDMCAMFMKLRAF